MEDLTVPFGSRDYWILAGLLVFTRGMDFLSTWIATPNLQLEANPIARRLGWKWGGLFNVALCGVFATLPLAAIIISTTSLLVAVRNLQVAGLMRSMGEVRYNLMAAEQLMTVGWRLYLFCLLTQTGLLAALGAALVWFSGGLLVPLAIGLGIIGYAFAVTLYTLLSVWRIKR
jgi:hypothetical protein